MELDRELIKELIKHGSLIVAGEIVGNVNPVIEWKKWLAYVPKFEEDRVKELRYKMDQGLSLEELEKLNKYVEHKKMLLLFNKYGTKNITVDEYVDVYEYMLNNSIVDLMESKLSLGELIFAKQEIEKLDSLPVDELRNKINHEQKEEVYNTLNMRDSYILHIISSVNHEKSVNELNEKINQRVLENRNMSFRSMYNNK